MWRNVYSPPHGHPPGTRTRSRRRPRAAPPRPHRTPREPPGLPHPPHNPPPARVARVASHTPRVCTAPPTVREPGHAGGHAPRLGLTSFHREDNRVRRTSPAPSHSQRPSTPRNDRAPPRRDRQTSAPQDPAPSPPNPQPLRADAVASRVPAACAGPTIRVHLAPVPAPSPRWDGRPSPHRSPPSAREPRRRSRARI